MSRSSTMMIPGLLWRCSIGKGGGPLPGPLAPGVTTKEGPQHIEVGLHCVGLLTQQGNLDVRLRE